MGFFAPALGFGLIVTFIVTGLLALRYFAFRIGPPRNTAGGGGLTADERELLEELPLQQGEIDQLRQRVSELEERVDFAERLLSKPRIESEAGPRSQ